MQEITSQDLKKLLKYDKDTGVFTWLQNRGGRVKTGSVAGSKHPDGYDKKANMVF